MGRISKAILLFCLMALPAAAAEQHSIAILQPVNVSGNTNLDHWRYLIGFMLDYQIGEVRKLRVIPESSIAYGMRELGITKGKALTSAQARSLGEAIEATRVVRLDYGTKDGKCRLTARMINVATGSESSEIAAEAADWFHADLKITKVILDQLNIKPTRDERNKLERPVAKSPEVYDLLGRAYAYNQEHAPIRIWKECLEQAQLKEPNCSEVLYFLAHTAVVEDKLKDAQEFAKAAIKAAPDNAGSHFLLAQIYGLTEQNAAEARDEMLAARVLDPNDATYVTGWAAMLERQEKYDEAITFYEKAEKLAPCDFRTHVNFFSCLVSNHKPDRARHELELAEKYCDEEDPFADEAMIEAYACLGNVRKVLYHIEHYLKNAKKSEMPNERIVAMEEAANTIRKDLKPTYLEVPEPPQMTPEELAKSLMARLTEDEYSLVTDPLAGGSAIVGWAKQLAQDAKDQRDKAVRIFDALTGRLEFIEAAGRRTAQQTMRDWRDTNTVFTCQEYTFLYIALARACGLRANYALVDKDVEGNFVFHACAAVFLDGKAALADPRFQIFGVKHQGFKVLDDRQAMAIYMSQLGDISLEKIAVKIAPELTFPHFKLALNELSLNHIAEARQQIDEGEKLDPGALLGSVARALLAEKESKLDEEIAYLKAVITHTEQFPITHLLLAKAYGLQGKLVEAREELHAYLDHEQDPKNRAEARTTLAKLNEEIANGK